MKKITRPIFIADDGKEFTDESTCLKYETALPQNVFIRLLSKQTGDKKTKLGAKNRSITNFEEFKEFVEDNRDWVLRTCLSMETEDEC